MGNAWWRDQLCEPNLDVAERALQHLLPIHAPRPLHLRRRRRISFAGVRLGRLLAQWNPGKVVTLQDLQRLRSLQHRLLRYHVSQTSRALAPERATKRPTEQSHIAREPKLWAQKRPSQNCVGLKNPFLVKERATARLEPQNVWLGLAHGQSLFARQK